MSERPVGGLEMSACRAFFLFGEIDVFLFCAGKPYTKNYIAC